MGNPEYVLLHLIDEIEVSVNVQDMFADLANHPDYPSLLSVSDILNDLDILNAAARYSISELHQLSTPFIVHLYSNNGEFALVNHIDDDYVTISNEWWSLQSWPIAKFKEVYSDIVLVIKSSPDMKSKRSEKVELIKRNVKNNAESKALPWKITLVDIGASYGLPAQWGQFVNDELFNLILVEPDRMEAKKLQSQYPKAQMIPYALGNKNGQVDFNVSLSQSCSSVLKPNYAVLDRFPVKKYFEIIKTIPIDIYRLDEKLVEMNISDRLNFVKIDVQGFEFEVLEGFGYLLDDVLCIELETHLVPIYENEKTLTEINNYLSERGFYLRHLETVGTFEGEVIEFDAYFVKRREKLTTKIERDMIRFWEHINQIPGAKRSLA
jgi:FkbM family methyltransferase